MGNSKERRLNDTVSLSQDTASKTGQSKRATERKTSIGESCGNYRPQENLKDFTQRHNAKIRR
jgi:hypothetical protein